MIRLTLALLTAALLATLSGCGTSASVRYYGLVPVSGEPEYRIPDETSISVGPFRVAEYLNRSQIVRRGDGVRLDLGEYDRWAEPLAKSFQRTVADNLASLLGSDRVLEFPAGNTLRNAYILLAQMTRFDTDPNGFAVLEVQWGIKDASDTMVVSGRRSRYTSPIDNLDDFDAVVTGLSQTIGQFSRDAASALAELP
jgi:uncharacterized lipoprotein YmbA